MSPHGIWTQSPSRKLEREKKYQIDFNIVAKSEEEGVSSRRRKDDRRTIYGVGVKRAIGIAGTAAARLIYTPLGST